MCVRARASVCLPRHSGQLSCCFVMEPKTLFSLLDISHAAASQSDLAFCSVRCLVYMLYQGFCDT